MPRGQVYVANEMEEPGKRNAPSLCVFWFFTTLSLSNNAVRMFTGSGSMVCTLAGWPSGLNGRWLVACPACEYHRATSPPA
jgi:hypothetical protein